MSIAHAQWQPTCFFMIQYGGFLSEKKVSLHFSLFTVITSSPYTRIDSPGSLTGHLHFTGTELKSSYLMMGVTSGHSDDHVTLV